MDVLVRNHKPNSYKPMTGTVVAFICPVHKQFIRGSVCPLCVEDRKIVSAPSIHVFKPMVYTDITDHPIYIESKKQLKEECKRHNVIAARLL